MGTEECDVEKSPTGTNVTGDTLFPEIFPNGRGSEENDSTGQYRTSLLRMLWASLLTLRSGRWSGWTLASDSPTLIDTQINENKNLRGS